MFNSTNLSLKHQDMERGKQLEAIGISATGSCMPALKSQDNQASSGLTSLHELIRISLSGRAAKASVLIKSCLVYLFILNPLLLIPRDPSPKLLLTL